MNLQLLLFYSFLGLTGLGLSSILVLSLQARIQRFNDRVATVVAPHVPARTVHTPTLLRLAGGIEDARVLPRIAALFGYDPDRPDQYPVRWWVVFPITLVLARIAAGLATSIFGIVAYLLILPGWVWLTRSFFLWFVRKRRDTLFRQFPDALAMIVRAVRVGIPVAEAIRMVARESAEPTAREFTQLSDQIVIGMPLDEALKTMGNRNNLPEYRFFATALSLQNQTGGGLAETLEGLADVIRKRVGAKSRGRALASEANTSAAILASIPVVATFGLWLLNPAYLSVLFNDPGGQRLLAFAIFLLGSGIGIMRTIIRRSLS